MKIVLADIDNSVVQAWNSAFDMLPNVYTYHGSIFDVRAVGALVSPANSFGFMNGGIDLAYMQVLGSHVQKKVQSKIKIHYGGELLVGQAFAIETDHDRWPWLIVAPTMRVPDKIVDPVDVYLSTRAALSVAQDLSVLTAMPGMGTCTGRVPVDTAARMMRMAFNDVVDPPDFPKSWKQVVNKFKE